MIATIIVLIEVTDPKVGPTPILLIYNFASMINVNAHVSTYVRVCIAFILYMICDALYICRFGVK